MTRLGFSWREFFALSYFAFGLGSYTLLAQDPPSRVARLNFVSGAVSMQPAGTNDWDPAVPNRPLTTGDYLWADQGSRAELHLNDSVMRINSETSFGFLNLDDRTVQVRLAQGELHVHLRDLDQDEVYEIDTPNAAISLLRNGDYRISVDSTNQSSFVVARHGEAEITGGGQAFTLAAGQSAELNGTDNLGYSVEDAPPNDGFESFCAQRDAREAGLAAQFQHVPPDMIGYEDLYGYGDWHQESGYGWVWFPRVAAGWAPYHAGHWAWIEPWGWTWVDDAPWGFAPFHYGRWAFVRGGWCWTPGPVVAVAPGVPVVHPVYAPALVAFFGGPHFSLSAAGGSGVAWVPLGPGEVYTPAYRVSPGYFRQVNVSNTVINKTVNITNVYNNVYVNKTVVNYTTVNQRFVNVQTPGAVTAMPQTAFASGRPVTQIGRTVPPAQMARVATSSFAVAPPVAPTQQALAPAARPNAKAPYPPASVMARTVVAKKTPPPAPVPFRAKQQFFQQHVGQPLNTQGLKQMAARQTAPAYVRPASAPVEPGAAKPALQNRPRPSASNQDFKQQPAAGAPGNVPHPPVNNSGERSHEQQDFKQKNPENTQSRGQYDASSQRAVPRPPNEKETEAREKENSHPHNANANPPKPGNETRHEQANPEAHPAEHSSHQPAEKSKDEQKKN